MTEEIRFLCDLVESDGIYPAPVSVTYDPMDMALPLCRQISKRLCEYIAAQPVMIYPHERLFGQFRFDGSVPADLFPRTGHEHFRQAAEAFYKKPLNNLSTFEWQHSAPDYQKILSGGVRGILSDITTSKAAHADDREKQDYLCALEEVCLAWTQRAKTCAAACRDAAADEADEKRRTELFCAAEALDRVPYEPAGSFYEALMSLYFCFGFLSDGLGALDRLLSPYYRRDLAAGKISREDAGRLIQELFLRIQAHTPKSSCNRKRGGECHFVVGGENEVGEDVFDDFSRLLVESLMALPIHCPQMTLRVCDRTPREILRFVMDCERHDPYKRIAFAGDTSRIRGLSEILGMTAAEASRYIIVGCNEPAFPGTLWMGGNTTNMARSLTRTLYDHKDEAIGCRDFDEFFALYRRYLTEDIREMLDNNRKFDAMRARDINVLSAPLFDGCVASAQSPTRGGSRVKIGGVDLMGFICVVDSLTIIRQFVFDSHAVSMQELIAALESDWKCAPELRSAILKNGAFFGNDSEISDGIAVKLCETLTDIVREERLNYGERILFGTMTGYNPHYAVYGAATPATPDGRHAGEAFMVGIGQTAGRDREGLTALLRSVALVSRQPIMAGPFVSNVTLDETLVMKDDNFKKLVDTVAAYFRMGGMQLQLNYTSAEKLRDAKAHPENYPDMKVRVSGFSGVFVDLDERIQDDVIRRTKKDR